MSLSPARRVTICVLLASALGCGEIALAPVVDREAARPADEDPGDAVAVDSGDGGGGDGGSGGDTGGEDEPACPAGMVPVEDDLGEVAYCIDAWENHLDPREGLGNADQGADWPDGSTTAVPRSREGVLPLTVVSWYQAMALCLNADKHLCSADEWTDACDGQLGEGGQIYLWGDEADETACVTLADDGSSPWAALQLTGSLATCASPVGAYDMAGNAWEWTDSGAPTGAVPTTRKVGGGYYSGGGNYSCAAGAVLEHPPEFNGTIGLRCCASPLR